MIKVSPRTKKTSFQVEIPEAQSVVIVGDFNGWDAQATPMKKVKKSGVWKADLQLESGEYEFRYLVDERQWVNDDAAPARPNPFGSVNSVAKVELAKAAQKASAQKASAKKSTPKRTKKASNGKA